MPNLETIVVVDPGGSNIAAVKAGSTAPVAGDPALVVTLSPNGNSVVTSAAALPSAFKYGRATVAVTNTAVQFGANALTVGVIVQALATNAAKVYIGDSAVTTSNGFELQPGQATSIAVSNTNALYINGTAADAVCFIGS